MVESQSHKFNSVSTKGMINSSFASSTSIYARVKNFEFVSFIISKNLTISSYLNISSHAWLWAVSFKNCEHNFPLQNMTEIYWQHLQARIRICFLLWKIWGRSVTQNFYPSHGRTCRHITEDNNVFIRSSSNYPYVCF